MTSKRFATGIFVTTACIALLVGFLLYWSPRKYCVHTRITGLGNHVVNAPAITYIEESWATVAFEDGRDGYELVVESLPGGRHTVSLVKAAPRLDGNLTKFRAPVVSIGTGGTAHVKIDSFGFDVRVERAS